jgi:hypothetical protein
MESEHICHRISFKNLKFIHIILLKLENQSTFEFFFYQRGKFDFGKGILSNFDSKLDLEKSLTGATPGLHWVQGNAVVEGLGEKLLKVNVHTTSSNVRNVIHVLTLLRHSDPDGISINAINRNRWQLPMQDRYFR